MRYLGNGKFEPESQKTLTEVLENKACVWKQISTNETQEMTPTEKLNTGYAKAGCMGCIGANGECKAYSPKCAYVKLYKIS